MFSSDEIDSAPMSSPDPSEQSHDENSIHDTLPPSQDPAAGDGTLEPPTDFWGILKKIGPGLIIAGSIVGSGELIATTKTGAQAGIALLWLIIIGCLIKVFVQIELGRYTITHGETTLSALDRVPCPRYRVNFIVWFWLLMMLSGVFQLGGIVGGVGQALALSAPLSGDYQKAIEVPSKSEIEKYLKWSDMLISPWDVKRETQQQAGQLDDLSPEQTTWTENRLKPKRAKIQSLILTLDAIQEPDEKAKQKASDAAYAKINLKVLSELEAGSSIAHRQELLKGLTNLKAKPEESKAILEKVKADLERQKLVQDMPEDARRRLLIGHLVIGEQLLMLDGDGFRGTQAVMIVDQDPDNAKAFLSPWTKDDKIWAAFVTLLTMALLYRGRYGMIQNVSLVLVVMFTFITIGNVLSLQATEKFHISADQFIRGLKFGIPKALGDFSPLATALAAFGIIGVGASELITYPYWCLEKGYAKFTGQRSDDEAWANRARGWMKVMHVDAFLSMIVYTIATLAFFLMGVAVLYNEGRDPDGMRMVSTLATAYVPVFGEYARWLFLIGAVAVLYSTFLVATAGNARMYTDGLKVFGFMEKNNEQKHDRAIRFFSMLIPVLCFISFCSGLNPVTAVLIAGFMQASMLPMIGFGALYLRHTRTDPRLKPSKAWDWALIISCIGLLIAGLWGALKQLI